LNFILLHFLKSVLERGFRWIGNWTVLVSDKNLKIGEVSKILVLGVTFSYITSNFDILEQ